LLLNLTKEKASNYKTTFKTTIKITKKILAPTTNSGLNFGPDKESLNFIIPIEELGP